MLETVGPELRQYIVTSNNEELPFSRDQRTWVYASAKKQNNYTGFGTDNDQERSPNYLIIKHDTLGRADNRHHDDHFSLPCAKVLGGHRDRRHAFRPASVVNISGMSFGSLSSAASRRSTEDLQIAGCLHNTGEGGISPHHLHGGDLIWQLGTGYFGARAPDGTFDREACIRQVEAHPVRAIEIKLSQGAKPGLGGVLPGEKVTAEISRIRGVPMGETRHQPSRTQGLLLRRRDARLRGGPRGRNRPPSRDQVGGRASRVLEGPGAMRWLRRTGASTTSLSTAARGAPAQRHSRSPTTSRCRSRWASVAPTPSSPSEDVHQDVVWMGAGKLGFPETALMSFCLGADMVAVGREAMLAIGCIQAQRCHTGHCPTGVATQNPWLVRGLDPTSKAERLANYVITLRKELTRLSHACAVEHPGLLTAKHMEVLDGHYGSRPLLDVFGYEDGWELPSEADAAAVLQAMRSA